MLFHILRIKSGRYVNLLRILIWTSGKILQIEYIYFKKNHEIHGSNS